MTASHRVNLALVLRYSKRMTQNLNAITQERPRIVVFDGVCVFCNSLVNFIIARDPAANISFVPMQSPIAKQLMADFEIDNTGMNTFVLLKHNKAYIRSSAALELSKDLSGYWRFLNVFRIIPRPLRDLIYRLVARNRYRWFGKLNTCMIPDDSIRARFIT